MSPPTSEYPQLCSSENQPTIAKIGFFFCLMIDFGPEYHSSLLVALHHLLRYRKCVEINFVHCPRFCLYYLRVYLFCLCVYLCSCVCEFVVFCLYFCLFYPAVSVLCVHCAGWCLSSTPVSPSPADDRCLLLSQLSIMTPCI